MSRSFTPSAITSAVVIVLAAACGHSSQTLDAYEKSKSSPITGTGGSSPSTGGSTAAGGTGGDTGTGGTGNMSGTGPVLPQFDCKAAQQQFDPDYMRAYSVPAGVDAQVKSLLDSMSPADKATQMIGLPAGKGTDYSDIERSPDVTVGGTTIRGYNYRDAGRGVNLAAGQHNRTDDGNNFSTVFPAESIRAASWDLDLEKRVGEAAGDETAASKNNMLLAPCMNIIRHPYWGRTQETYGEDSYHVGRMATAFTVGLQEYVTGCAKHFAANNVERLRSTQNALMDEQTLREIYGRHFEMVVQDGGIGCIMASYNMINNVKSTQNKHLLRDILKAPVAQGGMGYQGLVISDWWAMPGDQKIIMDAAGRQGPTTEAVNAGLDIEVPWTLHYDVDTLTSSEVDPNLITEAAKRILTQKFRFNSATGTAWSVTAPQSTLVSGAGSIDSTTAAAMAHEALAEEAEIKSAVLLKNGTMDTGPILPLTTATNIAVLGPDQFFKLQSTTVPKTCPITDTPSRTSCTFKFSTDPALGDRGSSRVNGDPARSIGPFAGIRDAAGSGRTVTSGNSPTADVVTAADTLVVVVGYTPGDEGEEYAITAGGDRANLSLPAGHEQFVSDVLDLGKPTVIIVESGSIVNLPWLTHMNQKQATIWAGYPGIRGGAALGKLIFAVDGANFAGKVPLAWPTQAQIDKTVTFKDPAPTGSTESLATHMGYFFGYRAYDRAKQMGEAVDMVFPFGHGLSYSTFTYSNLVMPCQTEGTQEGGVLDIMVDIANTSAVAGDEVAMLFVKPPPTPAGITGNRPVKELKSFDRVTVAANDKKTAHLPLRIRDLRRWEGDANGHWTIDSGTYRIMVGKDADDAEAGTLQADLTVTGY